ncbi:MAG: hypothetical protein IIW97_04225 [Alistipes sp.]|nr:hypothetical protein [Alistipes sp.]
MAYVAPNSTIKLLARVPLNNKYDETVWYTTASDQYGDMNDHVKLQLTQYSYQRHGRDYIRVTVPNVDTQHPTPSNNAADTLFDVNYMMFQNTNFGNKWFYAFVLDIEYINNSVAELKYEIDVMQTFMFDYLMPPVYIEREHSATDDVGDNVVEENIRVNDLVPYNNDNYRITFDFSECTFIILYHRNEATWRDATYAEMSAQVYPVEGGQIFNKIYSACDKAVVTGGTVLAADIAQLRQDIQDAVRLITDAKNTIACILQIPNYVIIHGGFVGTSDGRYSITPVTTSPVHAVYKIQRPTNFIYHQDALGTYTPLNNKLFTYPYNSIQLSNKEGATNLLRYEHFYDSSNMRLDFIHTTLPFFESTLAPVNYKVYYGVSGDYNPDDAIPGPNVPLPTYSMSSFELWKAQKDRVGVIGVICFMMWVLDGTPRSHHMSV